MEREKILKLKECFESISKIIDKILIYDEKETKNILTEEEKEKYKDTVGRFTYEILVLCKTIS